VADKTESLTTRINRHVNPLSSHYGEHRQQRIGAVHGQHEAQPGGGNSGGYPSRHLHHPTHSAGERTVDIPLDATDISSRDAPSPQVRRTWDRQMTTERQDWVMIPAFKKILKSPSCIVQSCCTSRQGRRNNRSRLSSVSFLAMRCWSTGISSPALPDGREP
jgi:hypothetical protein